MGLVRLVGVCLTAERGRNQIPIGFNQAEVGVIGINLGHSLKKGIEGC